MGSRAAQGVEGALLWREVVSDQEDHTLNRALSAPLLDVIHGQRQDGAMMQTCTSAMRDGASWGGEQSWTSVSSRLFNFLINCIFMVGQAVTWSPWNGKQTCKYQRTTASNCKEGRVDGEAEWPESYCLHGWEGT